MCGGSSGHLASLDVGSAKRNGIIQIVAGIASIICHSAVVIISGTTGASVLFSSPIILGTGILEYVFFILGGVFLLVAGVRRDFCWTVTALVFAALNVLNSFYHFFFTFVPLYQYEYYPSEDRDLRWPAWMVAALSIMMVAAYAQLFAVFWAIVIASKALYYRSRTPNVDFCNNRVRTLSLKVVYFYCFLALLELIFML